MTKFMQTASALTLAAALAGVPMIAGAQQATDTTVNQAVDNAAQQTKEAASATVNAAGEAVDAAGNKIENAADATKDAAKDTAQATGQAIDNAADATKDAAKDTAQSTGQAIDNAADATKDAAKDTAQAVDNAAKDTAQAVDSAATDTAQEVDVKVVKDPNVVVEGDMAAKDAAPEPVKGTIQMQDDNSILTSDLIGADLYNAQAEKIGEIDDAILSLDGTISGVVIGVGGFLGLGEKKVAVEMQQISVQKDKDGDPQLFIDTTKEALKAAPEFVTAADQRDEAKRMDAATSAAVPAPDTAPATAVVPAEPVPADATKPVQN